MWDCGLKENTSVRGYIWVGRNLLPTLLFHSFFFMGTFAYEVAILVFGLFFFSLVSDISFIYLTVITAITMALFLFEGISLNRKFKTKNSGTAS